MRTKKLLSFISVLFIILIYTQPAMAESNVDGINHNLDIYGNFCYFENKDGTITVAQYFGKEETVTFPSQINGKTVTTLGYGSSGILSGYYLYKSNSIVKHVIIPDTVTSLESDFYGVYETLKLSKNIKVITTNTFTQCRNLKELIVPEGVQRIEHDAFRLCDNLTKVVLPSTLEFLGGGAINCSQLKDITIKSPIVDIKKADFNDTLWYKTYSSNQLMYIGGICLGYKDVCTDGKALQFKEGTVNITDDAFSNEYHYYAGPSAENNYVLKNFPKGLKIIGDHAFMGNIYTYKRIKNIPSGWSFEIPETVEYIGYRAFQFQNLYTITVRSKNVKYGTDVFSTDGFLKLRGYEGSTTQNYAKENNIPFEIIKDNTPKITPPNITTQKPEQTNTPSLKTLTPKPTDSTDLPNSSIINTKSSTQSEATKANNDKEDQKNNKDWFIIILSTVLIIGGTIAIVYFKKIKPLKNKKE